MYTNVTKELISWYQADKILRKISIYWKFYILYKVVPKKFFVYTVLPLISQLFSVFSLLIWWWEIKIRGSTRKYIDLKYIRGTIMLKSFHGMMMFIFLGRNKFLWPIKISLIWKISQGKCRTKFVYVYGNHVILRISTV